MDAGFYPVKLFARPLKQILQRWVDKRIRAINPHWVPIGEFYEEDVFVVGYPKSGNTWFQNIVAGLIYGVDPEYAPDTLIQELVPDIHYKRYYKRFGDPMFFKSHHLPRPEYRRVVYLLRDGRDVMVSFYHFQCALSKRELSFLEMLKNRQYWPYGRWQDHVEAWLSNPYGADMIVIRYEDLKDRPVETLKKFCDLVGINRDVPYIERVVEKTTFEKMRNKEMVHGWDNPAWPEDKPFIRRGQVGSWKDEMPEEALEFFLTEARNTLKRCGYLIE